MKTMNVNITMQQLGGQKFMVMTGSKVYSCLEGLTLRLTKNKSRANLLMITLADNDAYTRVIDARCQTREMYDHLTTLHITLNHQRAEEGLEPLHLPNLWRTYNALCGRKAMIGDRVMYLIGCEYHAAYVIDTFENGDIRTDRDGARTRAEYTIINK